ncbi:YdgH/BhsA/McbA-like domain containing protein [Pantoea osteomyelitidis]|uniref:YdgH/BhsA/McbA-like domain containing protein n=1 Tax=Pantoea osteomyelitidis TaxID=3230026 RepID=A0ABW7Q0C6_9GAMM
MKTVKSALMIAVLSAVSFGSFAQSITATGSTLDEAELQIARQAHKAGAQYKITESYVGNQVHMTAKLIK